MDDEKKILKGSWDDLKDWPLIAAWRRRLYENGKTPDRKAINDAAAEQRQKTIKPTD